MIICNYTTEDVCIVYSYEYCMCTVYVSIPDDNRERDSFASEFECDERTVERKQLLGGERDRQPVRVELDAERPAPQFAERHGVRVEIEPDAAVRRPVQAVACVSAENE